MTNKYAEGYPGRRYYGGASMSTWQSNWRSTAPRSFSDCGFANVQPNSGSQANQGAFHGADANPATPSSA